MSATLRRCLQRCRHCNRGILLKASSTCTNELIDCRIYSMTKKEQIITVPLSVFGFHPLCAVSLQKFCEAMVGSWIPGDPALYPTLLHSTLPSVHPFPSVLQALPTLFLQYLTKIYVSFSLAHSHTHTHKT